MDGAGLHGCGASHATHPRGMAGRDSRMVRPYLFLGPVHSVLRTGVWDPAEEAEERRL